jgi:hypothetical protein
VINLVTKLIAIVCVIASVIASPSLAAAQNGTTTTTPYKGRVVSDVLSEFRRRGLNLVFSDALVPRSLRVKEEPRQTAPRAIVTEILAAHGLALKEEKRGALLVVKSRVKATAQEPQAASATSERGWIEGIILDQATQWPVQDRRHPERRADAACGSAGLRAGIVSRTQNLAASRDDDHDQPDCIATVS